MSAFGKRGGIGNGGGRPNFGTAKPMKGGAGGAPVDQAFATEGGDQFPPIDELAPPAEGPIAESGVPGMAALDRLTARQNATGDQASSKSEGFEASVHRI